MNHLKTLDTYDPWACLFLVWGIALFSGGWAADFGVHWDEDKLIQGIRWSVEHKTLLPHSYLYPSLLHLLSLIFLFLQGVSSVFPGTGTPFLQTLQEMALGHPFLISARLMTTLLSSLSIIWTAMAIWVWRKNSWEALLGAAFIGLSWEVNYHSRWFTVDPLMMQFGAFFILSLVQSRFSTDRKQWLIISAVIAGLAAGTKYTAGFCLVPLLTLLWVQEKGHSFWKKSFIFIGIFLVTFLLTTPGTLFDWIQLRKDLIFQSHTYYTLGNDAYTVTRGFPHFLLMGAYLGEVVFSWFTPIALFFSGLALLGLYDLVKREKEFAIVILAFPLVYLAFFSVQIVMIARNMLILVPFISLLAARGSIYFSVLISRPLRMLFWGFIVASLTSNAVWLIHSAWTIRMRDKISQAEPLYQYIVQHPHHQFLLTQGAVKEIKTLSLPKLSNVTEDYREPSDYTVFNTAEARERFHGRWNANRPHFLQTWFGSYEVNLNYYPTWLGNHRFVIMKTAPAMNLLMPPVPVINDVKRTLPDSHPQGSWTHR